MKRRISRKRRIRRRARQTDKPMGQMPTSNEPVQSFDEPQQFDPETILQLQQIHGNQFVTRMIQRAEPDDASDNSHSQYQRDEAALAEAVDMLDGIARGATLDMVYYRSKVIPNYINRKIWYASLKDISASQRLHHLQDARNQLQPLIKRYNKHSTLWSQKFRKSANECRIVLEKRAAVEKIIKRENELQDSSYGLGTLSEDKMRLQLITTVKTAEGIFKQVKEVSDKVLSLVDKGLGVGKDLAETESNPLDSLVKRHLAGEDVAAETKAVVNAKTAEDLTDKADDDTPSPKKDGQKTAQNIGDVMVALKGIGYALQIADVVKRENALKEILDKFPHPVATTANVAGKVFEVMQYGMDVSEVVLRRVAQAKGGDALKQVAGSLEMLGKASKALGGASSALFLIRDITVLLDDDSTEKQKSDAAFSAATNTASLGLLIAGAKGASYANPLAVSLFLTQVMLEQTGEHIFWKSNQTLISELSTKIFKHIDDEALYLPLSSSTLKARNEVMLSGKKEGADGQDIDPWQEDMIGSHVSEGDVRSSLKLLDLRMRDFVDVVLNSKSDKVRADPYEKPGAYGVIREYFGEFDYLQSTIDFDNLQGEELQDMVDEHLQSAAGLIKTYRMFRMQKGDISKVIGTRYEGDRNALADDVMKNKEKLSEVFA